jgi:ATP-binding cassette subfamily B protein
MKPVIWAWHYIKRYLNRLIPGLILCLICVVLNLVNPYVSGKLVGVIQDGTWRDTLQPFIIILLVVTLVRAVLHYCMLLLFEGSSQKVLLNMRQDIYNWVLRQNFGFFDTNRVGDIMARMTGDLDAVRHFVAYVSYAVVENGVTFIAAIVMILTVSWQLALLLLAVAPVICFCGIRQSREIKPAFFNIREQFSRLNSVCEENIGGNRVVKAFTQEDYEVSKFTAENQGYYDANVASALINVKYLPIMDFCAGLLNVFLLLGGGLLVIFGKLQLWQLVAVNGYLWMVNNPMRQFGWILNDIQNFFASVDKVTRMLRKHIYIFSPENAVHKAHIDGHVQFQHVDFSYDRNNPNSLVLKDVSFDIPAGSIVGIVGPTGSGKSTLVNLIGRCYDVTNGAVLVDGVDVRKYDLHDLRKGIAAANQDVFLFSDTVEGNIAYGVPDAPMSEVEASAEAASAAAFISELENGYDTIVGERGVGLSGGQKQRLSLSRALAVKPSILILDDTTSAVDMETEHDIQQALKRYTGRTTFIIAHRISSVKPADIILVMEDGRIIERGTHDELLAQKGFYYKLFLSQYGDFEKAQAAKAELAEAETYKATKAENIRVDNEVEVS